MPQRASPHPLVATLTQQATKALTTLRKEITQREQELAALKAQAAQWQRVLREPAREVGPAVHSPLGKTGVLSSVCRAPVLDTAR